MRFQKKSLTLVELLVLLGIIVILIGIVWVIFSPIREKARIIHCANNLKQIHLAIEMYRQDYGGREAIVGQRMEYWELGLPPSPWSLKPYMKSPLYCPLAYPTAKDSKDLWLVGYMWAVWRGRALVNSGPDWSEAIAKRGENFPISADCNHNLHGCKEFPEMFVIVLRLNGKIETKQIWVLGTGSHEW